MSMRVTIITTLKHNAGDDFVREGILYLLEQVLGDLQAQLIHKHIPVTARPGLEWYYAKGWSRLLDRVPKPLGLRGSKILDLLPLSDSSVARDLTKVIRGIALSPVLLVRGNISRDVPMTIADGYHRTCASYNLAEDTDIPARIIDHPSWKSGH